MADLTRSSLGSPTERKFGEFLPTFPGDHTSIVPPGWATNPKKGSLPANPFRNIKRKPTFTDTEHLENKPPLHSLSTNERHLPEYSENVVKPLPSLPAPNPNLPYKKYPKWAKDLPIEDRPGTISWRQVDPAIEGTSQAFGGTAGTLTPLEPPSELPNPPTIPEDDLTPEEHQARSTAIINRNTLFTLSDYEKIMLGRQQNHLRDLGNQANQELRSKAESMRFYNLSIAEISRNISQVVIAILADLLDFFSETRAQVRKEQSYTEITREFAGIFLANDRLIYVGAFMVILSMICMIIFLSS